MIGLFGISVFVGESAKYGVEVLVFDFFNFFSRFWITFVLLVQLACAGFVTTMRPRGPVLPVGIPIQMAYSI
jgi:hypothetical protein